MSIGIIGAGFVGKATGKYFIKRVLMSNSMI